MGLGQFFKKVVKGVGKAVSKVVAAKTGFDMSGLLAPPAGMSFKEYRKSGLLKAKFKDLLRNGQVPTESIPLLVADSSNALDQSTVDEAFAELENEGVQTKGLFSSKEERKEKKSLWGKLFPKDVVWYKRIGVWLIVIIAGVVVMVIRMMRKGKKKKW